MKISTNLAFWSAISGLVGTIIIFTFGVPPEIHADGHINLVLEQIDESQIRAAAIYSLYSKFGLGLIGLSFFLQFIDSVKHRRIKVSREAVSTTIEESTQDAST